MSERLKNTIRTDEWKNNISKASKGKIISEESKRKSSESHKGYIMPEEQKVKIRNALKGKKRPKEVIDKISSSKMHPVIITNILTLDTIIKPSTKEASEYCNCHIETLYSKIKSKQLINKTFLINYKEDIVES